MDLELLCIGLFAICGCVFFILFLTYFQQAVQYHGRHIGAGVDVVEVFDTERSIISSGDDAGNPMRSSLACHSRSNYFVRRLSRSLTAERSALIMPSIVREFSFEQIEAATDKFASSNIIKRGHSGDIYKGVLEGGEAVVIKRICMKLPTNKDIMVNSSNGYCDQLSMKDSYFAEMDIYGKVLDQSFLVPVLGQCLAKEDKFLVYEYMSFGDLASILARSRANTTHNIIKPAERVALKDEEVGMEDSEAEGCIRVDVEGGGAADFQVCPMLTWPVRMRIARDVAEALVYLHHESRLPLSHRNIQGSSIFFNKDFEVKLGSLGDAQTIESGEVPAYDIYCYGKLLLDLISGLDISGSYRDEEAQAWISMCFHAITNVTPVATLPSTKAADRILQLIDRNLLAQDHHLLDIIQVANLAKLCMEPATLQKLSMKRVLDLLPSLSN